MTHRISKWVSHSARENWRGKWLAKVEDALLPILKAGGNEVTTVLAKGPLAELTQQLRLSHGAASVVDARRPKIGVDLEPVAARHEAGRHGLGGAGRGDEHGRAADPGQRTLGITKTGESRGILTA